MGLKQGPVDFLSGTHPRVSSSRQVSEAVTLAGLGFCFLRTCRVLEKRVSAAPARVSVSSGVTGAVVKTSF